MRSKGRSRPMSATLTPKRKSARDRPASSKESERGGKGRESGREIDRGARGQQARAHSSPDSHPEGQYRTTLHRGPSPVLVLHLASRSRRPPPVVEPMVPPPCSPSIIVRRCRRRPRRRRPAWTPSLSAALVCLSRRHRARQHVTPVCVASARACVRNGGRGVWRAPQKRPRPLLPPPRQPPFLPGQTSIDAPLT